MDLAGLVRAASIDAEQNVNLAMNHGRLGVCVELATLAACIQFVWPVRAVVSFVQQKREAGEASDTGGTFLKLIFTLLIFTSFL